MPCPWAPLLLPEYLNQGSQEFNHHNNQNNSCINNAHISIQRMFKVQHSIIKLVVGYNFKTALTVHNFHSQGSIPCQAAYHDVTGKYKPNISFASYWVPIYIPGSRAAMWVNCLAEGQKYPAIAGFKPRSSEHTNIPQHLHLICTK